jgi:hypothetical protein
MIILNKNNDTENRNVIISLALLTLLTFNARTNAVNNVKVVKIVRIILLARLVYPKIAFTALESDPKYFG